MTVTVNCIFFLNVMLCSLVWIYRRFEGTCRIFLQVMQLEAVGSQKT